MNTVPTRDSTIRYYDNRKSADLWKWNAIGFLLVVFIGGASLLVRSLALMSCILLGAVVFWYLGYWLSSKTCYFISSTKVGFKDFFGMHEVRFDEIRSVSEYHG